METSKKVDHKIPKRKKPNFLSRLGQRISKVFMKSKSPNVNLKNGDDDISKSCLDDLPVTSKSHDNLKATEEPFKTKRKKFGSFLRLRFSCLRKNKERIPSKNDRCLSEGDLTRDEDKFYSGDSSPNPRIGRKHDDSSKNDMSLDDSHNNNDSVLKDGKNFKNELALRLKSKIPPKPKKDDESDSSKTPDSPTGNCTGTSPSRQIFNGSRTPYSMSSLSHSSNSLISGNAANNYGTSDGESMSRSVIDSNDDIGIVVDLATPISKTTTASLLDSTAARQKIAASRPRRARPKANDHVKSISGDKSKDSGKFSPVRENRDILEEISEEDSQPPSNSPTSMEDDLLVNSCPVTETNLNSSALSQIADSPNQSSLLDHISSSDVKDVPLQDSPETDQVKLPLENNYLISDPSNSIVVQSNESDDSIVKSVSPENFAAKNKIIEIKTDNSASHLDSDMITSKFKANKMKFGDQENTSKFNVTLRPVNARLFAGSDISSKEGSGTVNKCTSWAPTSRSQIESRNEIQHHNDDHIENRTKVNRYTPMNPSEIVKLATASSLKSEIRPAIVLNNPSHQTNQNAETITDKRRSRVCDLIKNLESSVHCANSH